MYKIMIIVQQHPNGASAYEFYRKKDDEGFMRIFETDDKVELEKEVKNLLNKFSKKQFIIVQQLDYELDTDIDSATADGE